MLWAYITLAVHFLQSALQRLHDASIALKILLTKLKKK